MVKYLPTGGDHPDWGLSITTAGFQAIAPGSQYPPPGHPEGYSFQPSLGRKLQDYQLVYVTRGTGSFSSATLKSTKIEEGTVFMLFPHEWHTYQPDMNTGWDAYWIGFTGSFTKQAFKQDFLNKNQPVFKPGLKEDLVHLFLKVIELAREERPGYRQAISGATIHLLGLLTYYFKNRSLKDNPVLQKMDKARLIMRENIDGKLKPEEIAASLNIGYSWFRKAFRDYTGLAPAQYHLQLKVQRAKELLQQTSKSIKEIALLLNFDSADYFSSYFKKKTGFTPGEFRELGRGRT